EKKGAEILKAAADEKSPLAQTLLADLYERGVGVEKNEKEAVRYYIMAAKQGEPLAKQKLESKKK
ncbi:MAG: SEL1-like repeat protein, partial [Elusimicrobiaceae bacterium]|nr:SEL1-like repeat protein [Elusimicrobiaceae bacterium]